MRKVRSRVTSNLKTGKNLIEYDNFTYKCKDDDIWVTTEIPVSEKPTSNK